MGILELPRNRELLNTIMSEYSSATDLASVLVNIHGKEISDYHNFTSFCQLIRSKKEFRHLCQKCDQLGGLESSKAGHLVHYKCHAGLIDFSLPIIVNDQLTGFLLCGQIIVEDKDIPTRMDFSSDWSKSLELCRAYENVPRVSHKKVASAISILDKISNYYLVKEMGGSRDYKDIRFHIDAASLEQELRLPAQHKNEIKKALTFIDKNLNRPITLEETADHVYLSHYYFSKLFKKEMNMNFVTYINNKKIEKAKIFLLESNWSIENISRSLGFRQTSYFCKLFKNTTQSTPADFRRQMKGLS